MLALVGEDTQKRLEEESLNNAFILRTARKGPLQSHLLHRWICRVRNQCLPWAVWLDSQHKLEDPGFLCYKREKKPQFVKSSSYQMEQGRLYVMACREDNWKLQSPAGLGSAESCMRSGESAIQGIFLCSPMQKFPGLLPYSFLHRKKPQIYLWKHLNSVCNISDIPT